MPCPPGQETVEVEERLRFDEGRLRDFLAGQLPGVGPGTVLEVKKFGYGASNPTFFVGAGELRYVLRKKPPGALLKGAHAVEREFRVMRALQQAGFATPVMHLLCEDVGVIGTPFYVMSFVEGQIPDNSLSILPPARRRPALLAIVEMLARLHGYDPAALGLVGGGGEPFGRIGGFYERQIRTMSRVSASQVENSKGKVLPLRSMPELLALFAAHMPEDRSCVIHGDWKPDNLILGDVAGAPRVLAVVDWELSTIGHPMSDLANMCLPYHLGPIGQMVSYGTFDLSGDGGVPSEEEVHRAYCSAAGAPFPIKGWSFFVAFACFRLGVIIQGVAMRASLGQGSQKSGFGSVEQMAQMADALCDLGLEIMGKAWPAAARL